MRVGRGSLEACVNRRRWLVVGKNRSRTASLKGLIRFADLFGLGTRRSIKALAGDYDIEIRRLLRERRPHMARWNAGSAWGYALWSVLGAPSDRLVGFAIKLWGG